jgi:mono/diheme cytochrome c family protein
MGRYVTLGVCAAIVALGFALALLLAARGPEPFAFAGGRRVRLADYRGPDPTGVPPELQHATLIERGEYLTRAADCEACHSKSGGVPFAGGLPILTPFGAIFSTNITPDEATGIGNYSDADFLSAVRKGVRRDGARLFPAMPYASYAYMTDADALAIKAYLFNLKPSHAPARADTLLFPFNQRLFMSLWSLLFTADRRYEPDPNRSDQWNRGAYLAEAMAHCGDCHTPRNPLQALDNRRKFAGAAVDGWIAFNLTADRDSGLGNWSDSDLVAYLGAGHAAGHGSASGPMGEVVSKSLAHLTPGDLSAIVAYLRTIPAIRTLGLPPIRSVTVAQASAPALGTRGQAIFDYACAACHGTDGNSRLTPFATLAGSRAVNDPQGTNVVQVVLSGAHDYKAQMPAFGSFLSDDDVAAVTNYVTGRFGANQSTLTGRQVAKARGDLLRSANFTNQPTTLAIEPNLEPHPPLDQPIAFSHKTHVALGLPCSSCHENSPPGDEMSLPPTATCMSCHAAVDRDHPQIIKLAQVASSGRPAPWVRVYPLTPGIQFNHDPHLRAGLQCATCHGAVGDQTQLSELTALTSMATCISCHKAEKAPTDCATCHIWPNDHPDPPDVWTLPEPVPFGEETPKAPPPQ